MEDIKRKSRNGAKDKKPRVRNCKDMPTVHVYKYNQLTFLLAFKKIEGNRIVVKQYFNDINYDNKLANFLNKYHEKFGVQYEGDIIVPRNYVIV